MDKLKMKLPRRLLILLGLTLLLTAGVINLYAGWNFQYCSGADTNNCDPTGCTGGCTDTYNPDVFCAPGIYYCPNSTGASVTETYTPGSCTLNASACGCPPTGAPATSGTGTAKC